MEDPVTEAPSNGPLEVRYDPARDIVHVDQYQYAGHLFRQLHQLTPPGKALRIVALEPPVISVMDIRLTDIEEVEHQRDRALEDYERAMHRVAQLENQVERMQGWLALIDGGDAPCSNAWKLRDWARRALAGDPAP